jgi:dihydrofolate reductase
MSLLPVIMVAAMARNGVIGADNGLPWHMRSDLRHFKAATMGKPLIMGRKTFQSIGRLLPGRETVIVTHDPAFRAEGAHVVDGIEAALSLADMLGREKSAEEIVIAGGAMIYEQAMAHADRLLVTILDLEAQGDAAFPRIDAAEWEEVSRRSFPRGEGDDAAYDVVRYVRAEAHPTPQ